MNLLVLVMLLLASGAVQGEESPCFRAPLTLDDLLDAQRLEAAVKTNPGRPLYLVTKYPAVDVEQVVSGAGDLECVAQWLPRNELGRLKLIGSVLRHDAVWENVSPTIGSAKIVPPGRYRVRLRVTDNVPIAKGTSFVRVWTLYSNTVQVKEEMKLEAWE